MQNDRHTDRQTEIQITRQINEYVLIDMYTDRQIYINGEIEKEGDRE